MVDPSQLPQSLQHLMAHVQPLIERYGYWGLGICIFVEGIGIPAPGQSLLIISAALAAQGQMNIAIVLAVAGVSTWLGGQLGYWIGLYAGRPLLLKLPISNSHLTRIHRFFQSWGVLVILIGRFIDGLRQLAAMVAGTIRMSQPRFFLTNLCGALLWTGTWGIGAYALSHEIHPIVMFIRRWRHTAFAISVIALLVMLIYLLIRNKNTDISSDQS